MIVDVMAIVKLARLMVKYREYGVSGMMHKPETNQKRSPT